MPDTPLMGPDGKPAIDAATGMPLTMEEMLRRRGIVQMGNTTSMMSPPAPPQDAQGMPPTGTPTGTPVGVGGSNDAGGNAAVAALAARAGATAAPPAPVASPTAVATNPTTPGVPVTAVPTGADGGSDLLSTLGMLAGATGVGAAGYALYNRARKSTHPGVGVAVPSGGSTAKRIESGKPPLALPAPQKRLTGPSSDDTTAAAKALAGRGNQPALEDMRYIGEGVKSTVSRAVPKRAPTEPLTSGLARTLARIARGL